MTKINATPHGDIPFTDEENAAWDSLRASEEYLAKELEVRGNDVRADRDAKLAECDWTVLADSPLTTSQKTAWKTYRQALRDITSGDDFPHNITWPSQP